MAIDILHQFQREACNIMLQILTRGILTYGFTRFFSWPVNNPANIYVLFLAGIRPD